MTDKLIIPMVVLAHHLKSSLNVPSLNPNYATALSSYLGKDGTPGAFNTDIPLKKGVHLHFVLPSALKKGTEIIDEHGEKSFDYPAVPDCFIVTRMYVKNGKIETDCNIVESNFYSLDYTYQNSITIPKFDDYRKRMRYRYMGRTYPASSPAPTPVSDSGYFDKITAVGPGDPMFSAYYPSCMSVFGFHDSLEGVPSDAVLSYFVIGYYSNSSNDIFNNVKNIDDMREVLLKNNLSVSDNNNDICNSCVLFGEVSGINLSEDYPVPSGQINIGIGRSSAEALSAIIKGVYYDDPQSPPDIERFLTAVQYDTADESAQPDGDFKIDDDIHFRGFSRTEPIESTYSLRLPKDISNNEFEGFEKQYSNLLLSEHDIGKLRRILECKRNSLYYLWECYMGTNSGSEKEKQIIEYINHITAEISELRGDIYEVITELNKKKKAFEDTLIAKKAELETTDSEPFHLQKDPVVMLFGEGMKRTYAFGEDGRFESDNSLFCLTRPLSADISADTLLKYFKNLCLQNTCEDYKNYAVTAVLLDTLNILPGLKLSAVINDKFSPIMFNGNPKEQVTLLMQWESAFYPNYDGSDPENSRFEYGGTDYCYKGAMSENRILCSGVTALTPHGVYNLQDKLKKYLEYHSDSPHVAELVEKIKDLPSVSQSLGGFNISLTGLKYAFQFPVDIDPTDEFSKGISKYITPENPKFYEPPAERLAVCDNSQIFPLGEGFFGLQNLAVTTSFGVRRKIIEDNLGFKGVKYFSENMHPVNKGYCSFPLTLTSASRLSMYFVTADDNKAISSPLPNATPVIGIFMPDMLNRNLNVFSNSGEYIGVIKTAYRIINKKKVAVGRFAASPNPPAHIDSRINDFISALTQDNSAFTEIMNAIDDKLNVTLPLSQNNFIFGRALVLAEISVELEFFGMPEWSKKDNDIGKFDDIGLSEQKFPVMFGDKNRVTDGVCCGFYNGFSKGFTAFGAEKQDAEYLSAEAFSVKSADGEKNVTILFDPMLKVTVNTGFLPVKQLEIYAEHTDFSKFQLMSAELNTVISDEEKAELPDFTGGVTFDRLYTKLANGKVTYEKLKIEKPTPAIGSIGKTIITDGVIIERSEKNGGNYKRKNP